MAGQDEIKLDYPKAEKMASAFKKGKEELNGIKTALTKIASDLEGGAMLGDGGTAYVHAIREVFLKNLDTFIQKIEEEAADVDKAVKKMQAADSSAAKANASAF
jgi:WXG100 family type VII secretion target